jgi:hypothetical protein
MLMVRHGLKLNRSLQMASTEEILRPETKLIVDFLRESAERIMGKGMYDKTCDPVAVHWMCEAIELAADAIEKNEHLIREGRRNDPRL